MTDNRYQAINTMWREHGIPPCSSDEAMRATRKLEKKFGKREDGSPNMAGNYIYSRRYPRVCWISRKGGTEFKGWPRLVHDLSHFIFRARHPSFRPHEGGHAKLEQQMTEWLIANLSDMRDKPKAKLTTDDRRKRDLERTEDSIERWKSKQKRAANAIRKLTAKRKRLIKLTGSSTN